MAKTYHPRRSHFIMKLLCGFTVLLTAAVAYYVYIPLPRRLSEPWKLLVVAAAFRGVTQVADITHSLGLGHHIHIINHAVTIFESLIPVDFEGVQSHDAEFHSVPVRVYEPTQMNQVTLRRAVVFFHGGGWSLGFPKLGSYDLLCRKMAAELNAVVVTVDYHMAPDVRFPVQYEDCLQATRHFLRPEVLAHYSVEPQRVAVCGDSAGGNLAAAVAQQIGKDNSTAGTLKLQVLIYPVLQALDFNTASYQQNLNVPILYRELMVHYWLEYLGADPNLIHSLLLNNHTAQDQILADPHRTKLDWMTLLPKHMRKNYKPVIPAVGTPSILKDVPALLDSRAAPLLAEEEVLSMAARAYIMTCEHDVLRDDGTMYGLRLQQAGVSVTLQHYEDCFHGCVSFAFWPLYFSVGIRAVEDYIAWLQENL
ncbi:neutral cholesterol ester hydrolase 1a [Electrophorus electricus]|uniref:neutral cholesterol ester hydrolase 1a n=1 Tax=Electrophorus electricus TaxID=8005 RepID=UPI000F09EA99|nr:neutral cholesterol ester hydrolase 1a [Electrophorus electricus]